MHRIRFFRRVLAALTAGVLLVCMTACGGNGGDSDSSSAGDEEKDYGDFSGQTLTVAVNYKYYAADIFKEIVQSFSDATGAEVRTLDYSEDYTAKINAGLSSDDAPDVFMAYGYTNDYFAKYAADLSGESYVSRYTDAAKVLAAGKDGKYYTLPLSYAMYGIIVNTAVCKSAGVDPASVHTWDDFADACAKIKAKGITPIGSSLDAALLSETSASFLTVKGSADVGAKLLDGSWDFKEYADVLDYWQNAVKNGWFFTDASDLAAYIRYTRFASGQSAFLIGENSDAAVAARSYAQSDDFMPAPYPAKKEGGEETLTAAVLDSFAVNKKSSAAECGKAFLRFLADSADSHRLVDINGGLAGLKDMKGEEDIEGTALLKKTVKAYSGLVFKNSFLREYMPKGMWSALNNAAGLVFSTRGSSAESVATLKNAFDKLRQTAGEAVDDGNILRMGGILDTLDDAVWYTYQLKDRLWISGPVTARKVMKTVKVDKNTTVFLGDSFFDCRTHWGTIYSKSYKDKNIFDVAIGGSRASHWPFIIDRVFAGFGGAQPKNIVINIGTNDLAGLRDVSKVSGNIEYLIQTLHKKFPDTKIYWCSVAHRYTTGSWEGMNDQVDGINDTVKKWISDSADSYAAYVDTVSKITENMLSDGLHPTIDTYETVFVPQIEAAGCKID